MEKHALTDFIVNYVEKRLQAKLITFDKEADKALSTLKGETLALAESELLKKRRELEQLYEIRTWLTDAAKQSYQIKQATHILKFTHSSAKGGSSVLNDYKDVSSQFLSTASLINPVMDTAISDAKVLGIAALLTEVHQDDSLIAALKRRDYSALEKIAEGPEQLEQWVTGFQKIFIDPHISSHKFAKQIFFPISTEKYHLISPLYSSSLAQALYQRITHARFSEEAKAIKLAQKENRQHEKASVFFPNLAVQNIGGTKPQNISALNSARSGRSYLLSCAAPQWKTVEKPPQKTMSIFHERSEVDFYTRATMVAMHHFLLSVRTLPNNRNIRRQRLNYLDQLIDQLFFYISTVQNMRAGWSVDSTLSRAQQLWLDPHRGMNDAAFRNEREAGDWQAEVAYDFGRWLNSRLKHERLLFGEAERREWSTATYFKRRLRNLESLIKVEIA
ncbi:type I-F CRISPR-associated protein Csy1 [Biostraticola tofi]|uniref:CRISPR-associated Csy1 family protein n=1 Tax=Biostraticola tofi TaxID=466109 RepID=A0A4R3YH86_9GAMM|nr:type I-F CRISPR-associated protein Csy1 [Biostraticola tofi]TCV91566.1 CRISPR-associated Csy1 family protein [Biostraticola tofi]